MNPTFIDIGFEHSEHHLPDNSAPTRRASLTHSRYRLDNANKRVAQLVKDFPANPYYLMAATEIIFQAAGSNVLTTPFDLN